MARVFTITPGLENMGGLKTGGQGSIYKGRRIGEIITAVKILPTPIYSESGNDKNYTDFENEVAKLKKVNEIPNPNVVKILSSGISDAGSFPFIEMEYIEGPDLEELLQIPGHPVFTIGETLKVAEQLSGAIAHCHRMDVRHGDIKSNNVKFHSESCNYILLDFGLALMTDDQRRSNLRQAGSIEFMAPEQNTGQMLFQTDVYSFGIVLFELLAGKVPFRLNGQGESARNEVRLAHMASPVPDVIELRREALPAQWDNEKKIREMQVPQWLVKLINKCLEKKPERRFANGIELHNHIVQQIISRPQSGAPVSTNQLSIRPLEEKDFIANHEQLKKQLSLFRQDLIKKEGEVATLKELLEKKKIGLSSPAKFEAAKSIQAIPKNNRVSSTSFVVLLLVTIALGAFATYPVIKKTFSTNQHIADNSRKRVNTSSTSAQARVSSDTGYENNNVQQTEQTGTAPAASTVPSDSVINRSGDDNNRGQRSETTNAIETPIVEKSAQANDVNDGQPSKPTSSTDENGNTSQNAEKPGGEPTDNSNSGKNDVSKKYLVVAKAYFYNEPNESSKRNEFISPLEKAVVQALNERYGFIYVVITNPHGQVFKGWLRKKELKLYSTE